ncbi:MAG: site-2 protease family protein [Chlorobiales bacterium]|nr:site-2 protease family protein [Chlorobiales bacterium]
MSFPIFQPRTKPAAQNYPLHLTLFLLTVITTLWAGAFWGGHSVTFSSLPLFLSTLASGIPYSFCLLLFLSIHEFGHFFATLHHRVQATLPYYIPVPPLPLLLSLGTMGAVIKIKERISGTNALFDIGIAGPLSGFFVCAGLLIYGFLNLPPADFIYTIHPEFLMQGGLQTPAPEGSLCLGKNLLWMALEYIIAPKNLPPMTEMYHYPFLFTGWLGSLVTALNLLPVGQLDGGHITYTMFGRKGHEATAKAFLVFIIVLGSPAFLELLLSLIQPAAIALIPPILLHWSWSGWMLWAIILSRLIGVKHPQTWNDHPLATPRKIVGWIAIAIFVLTFTPVPFSVT